MSAMSRENGSRSRGPLEMRSRCRSWSPGGGGPVVPRGRHRPPGPCASGVLGEVDLGRPAARRGPEQDDAGDAATGAHAEAHLVLAVPLLEGRRARQAAGDPAIPEAAIPVVLE